MSALKQSLPVIVKKSCCLFLCLSNISRIWLWISLLTCPSQEMPASLVPSTSGLSLTISPKNTTLCYVLR